MSSSTSLTLAALAQSRVSAASASETIRRFQGRPRPGRLDLDALAPDCRVGIGTAAGIARDAAARRAFDLVLSLAMLLLTLPLLLLVAMLVKLDSPGPVFYRQERVGLGGRPFTVFKFRSMRRDAEAAGPQWATERDPRVTRLGRLLRLTRMDELPQLLNVLHGSMSLVGPRPERPHFVDQLSRAIPHFGERVLMKPGVTGWAQVNYPYGASVEDARQKLAYDLYYLRYHSLLLDLRILLATVRVVIGRNGAR